jgi:PAS domain S-box-containing protein
MDTTRDYLRHIIDSSLDMIITVDPNRKITEFNKAAQKCFGYSLEEVVGKPVDMLYLTPAEGGQVNLETVTKGKFTGEVSNRRKDGSIMFCYLSASPILDEDGNTLGVMGISRDITEQKKADEALKKAKEEADEANRAKSEFIATMSHEIRTPMNAIIGMTNLTLETTLAHEQRENLEMVRHSSNSLLSLINDILDLSKIEAGKLALEKVDFDLGAVVESLVTVMSAQAQQKGLVLHCHISPKVSTRLKGDPGRLRQIIMNLLANAIKFTEKGEIVMSVDYYTGEHAQTAQQNAIALYFSVKDTGIGIPEEKKERIFESFVQADSSTTRKYGGTGLGLSISRHLVNLMGGAIWVESAAGMGSIFHFTALFAPGSTGKSRKAKELSEAPSPALPLAILLVEDNEVNRKLALHLLSKRGHKVKVAHNGQKAVEMLSRENFDLVLMDVHMPEMDGYAATRLIRDPSSLVLNHTIPIIAMTANAMKGDREICLEAGMNDYVSKPLDRREFLRTVEKTRVP